MSADILSIAKSGLFAAQTGLATAGNNISNANVPGYSREAVIQASSPAQNFGSGFEGQGTYVSTIKRYSDSFLTTQVNLATTSKGALDAYAAQINQVDNLLADTTSGLSPALQDFFKGVQDLSSNPSSAASRQALLSTADSLAARFQGLNGRLQEIGDGVNNQITSNVVEINSFAKQIAQINGQISLATTINEQAPNALLDQRDQLIADLNKQVKATALISDNNTVTVSIGTGQPLVVGTQAFQLAAIPDPENLSRTEVGYVTGNTTTVLAESALNGGELGGLFDFRSTTLDTAQNELGRIAVGLAVTYNNQHKLGQDQSGVLGGDFFNAAPAVVGQNIDNNPLSTTVVSATVSDPTKLTTSDYEVKFDGNNFSVVRKSDNQTTLIQPFPQAVPQTIDGVDFSISGNAAAGDEFLVRPTINGAASFSLLIHDTSKIAAAAPIITNAPITNTGTGAISPGSVDNNYLIPANQLAAPITLTYDAPSNSFSGFPAAQDVTVTVNGVPTLYPAPSGAIPFTAGATYTFGGASIVLSGAPANGDVFTVGPNLSGVGDNRNASLLGNLQATNLFDSGTATYQGAYAELVSTVGNKAREVQVNGTAGDALLSQAQTAQQSVAGVNLDEEASNLLRYQQAYQASAKVMQVATEIFTTLITALGGT